MSKLRCTSSEDGAVLLLVVIVLMALLAMAALAIDLGVFYVAVQQAHNTADAASLAAAGQQQAHKPNSIVKQAAIETAHANTILGDPVVLLDSDIEIRAWDLDTRTLFDPNNPPDPAPTNWIPAVRVTVRRTQDSGNPVPTFFAKTMGIDFLEVTRSATAGPVPGEVRDPLEWGIVHDASSSFQAAWDDATEAVRTLMDLINTEKYWTAGDAAAVVAFNSALDDYWMKTHRPAYGEPTYYDLYKPYPGANTGIKNTTDLRGRPVKTNEGGFFDPGGLVRPMTSDFTEFDSDDRENLPDDLDTALNLLKNGEAWGDTDTAVGLNYMIDQLLDYEGADNAQKVIVLISDGLPHDWRDGGNPTGPYTGAKRADAIEAADRAGEAGIMIFTITLEGSTGVAYDFNESLCRNGGLAFRANYASELEPRLREILESLAGDHPALLQ